LTKGFSLNFATKQVSKPVVAEFRLKINAQEFMHIQSFGFDLAIAGRCQ